MKTQESRISHDELLHVQDVATKLGTSPAMVYKLCSDRKLGHIRLGGGSIRITAAQIENFLAVNTVSPVGDLMTFG